MKCFDKKQSQNKMLQSDCFKLVGRKDHRRSGAAVLVFPGLIPTYSNFDSKAKLFSQFGDVLEFHYPNKSVDIQDLYREVTDTIKELRYKKIILLGISCGGTVAYLLARYWRKHRIDMGLSAFVAASTPFQPENLTPRSQFELDLGATLDTYARKVLIFTVRLLKFIWRFSFGLAHYYAKDSSVQQTMNGIRMGYILRQDWVVRRRFLRVPALLLNTRDGIIDPFVSRGNELNFLDIFPHGKVMRVLNSHADIRGMEAVAYRQIAQFIREALRRPKGA